MPSPAARTNDPTLLILTSLASGEKHGYALLQDIEDFADVTLGPGTLYGAITRLEDRGLIEAIEPTGRRRPYRLTQAGTRELADQLSALRAVTDEGSRRLAGRPGTAAAARPAVVRPAGGLA